MSIFRCCIGADSRIPPEASRPVGSSARTQPKVKPAQVFFDVPKPDPQLSSVTDPPTSGRDAPDHKKKKDSKEKEFGDRNLPPSSTRRKSTEPGNDMGVADNNGLTRGQNFMKVEKWLRDSCMQQQIAYTPGVIRNIEDSTPCPVNEGEEPPSEKDRLANNVAAAQSHKRR